MKTLHKNRRRPAPHKLPNGALLLAEAPCRGRGGPTLAPGTAFGFQGWGALGFGVTTRQVAVCFCFLRDPKIQKGPWPTTFDHHQTNSGGIHAQRLRWFPIEIHNQMSPMLHIGQKDHLYPQSFMRYITTRKPQMTCSRSFGSPLPIWAMPCSDLGPSNGQVFCFPITFLGYPMQGLSPRSVWGRVYSLATKTVGSPRRWWQASLRATTTSSVSQWRMLRVPTWDPYGAGYLAILRFWWAGHFREWKRCQVFWHAASHRSRRRPKAGALGQCFGTSRFLYGAFSSVSLQNHQKRGGALNKKTDPC